MPKRVDFLKVLDCIVSIKHNMLPYLFSILQVIYRLFTITARSFCYVISARLVGLILILIGLQRKNCCVPKQSAPEQDVFHK